MTQTENEKGSSLKIDTFLKGEEKDNGQAYTFNEISLKKNSARERTSHKSILMFNPSSWANRVSLFCPGDLACRQ